MSKYFDKFAAKAQSALGDLAARHQQPSASNEGTSPPAQADNSSGLQGGGLLKQHGLGGLQNQLRALQVQYSKQDNRQVQLVITAQKSVALDFDSAGKDAKTYSKELYIWGQEQAEDIKDVSDRLAYLNFVHGALTSDLAVQIDSARNVYKTARNSEAPLHQRRLQRSQMEQQILKIREEGDTPKNGGAKRAAELEAQRSQMLREDESAELEAESLKRTALREGEAAKWRAVREYAEKLLLLSQASEALVSELPATSNPVTTPYIGQARTASVRMTLQQRLDSYRPGSVISLSTPNPFSRDHKEPLNLNTSSSNASLAPSFGQTHESELARTPSVLDKQKAAHDAQQYPEANNSPPLGSDSRFVAPAPNSATRPSPSPAHGSGGVDPSSLNNAPAPIPISSATLNSAHATGPTGVPIPTAAVLSSSPPTTNPFSHPITSPTAPLNIAAKHSVEAQHGGVSSPAHISGSGSGSHFSSPPLSSTFPAIGDPNVPPSGPTVAETGVPVQAGQGGPGPASGSLSRESGTLYQGYKASPADRPTQSLEGQHSQGWSGPGIGGVGGFKEPDQTNASPAPQPSGPAPGGGVGGFKGYESAEEEKKRLQREEREKLLGGSSSVPGTSASNPAYPTAEDEKKRLEREERERILNAQARQEGRDGDEGQAGVPPPYTD